MFYVHVTTSDPQAVRDLPNIVRNNFANVKNIFVCFRDVAVETSN